jgi:hypothetical protein
MSKPRGSVAGTATIKLVTPDVRAPSRSWSLAFLDQVFQIEEFFGEIFCEKSMTGTNKSPDRRIIL